ncbi:Leucine-responsive regulatory protein [Bacillus cereus]|nr:Leucine-responsive regulatory protein [Bacillus cereus]
MLWTLHTSSHQQLEEALADVLHYGDYRINTVIKTLKKVQILSKNRY